VAVGVFEACFAHRHVFACDAHGPGASSSVVTLAHIVELLQFWGCCFVEFREVAVGPMFPDLLLTEAGAVTCVAPMVDLCKVVNTVQIVVSLDFSFILKEVPGEDNVQVVPKVPTRIRINIVKL